MRDDRPNRSARQMRITLSECQKDTMYIALPHTHTHTGHSKSERASETLVKIEGDTNKRKKEMEWVERKEWMFVGGHGAT